MAIGDKASAKGLQVFPQTQDLRLGYQNDNQRGDDIADEIDDRIAGDALAFPAAKIIIQEAEPTVVSGGLWFKPV